MFDALFDLFKPHLSLRHLQEILGLLDTLIDMFEEDYLKDQNAKNAAIDAVVEILQKYKDPS